MNRREIFKAITAGSLAPITKAEVIRKPAIVYGIVVDESGSMSPQRKATIDGFNAHIEQLKRDSPANLDTRLFVVVFHTNVDRAALNVPLSAMPLMRMQDYIPIGMTALYDAVGYTTAEMERVGGDDTSYVLTIITDGEENSSKEWTESAVAARLTQLQETGKWTVTYIGADNLDLSKEGSKMKVSARQHTFLQQIGCRRDEYVCSACGCDEQLVLDSFAGYWKPFHKEFLRIGQRLTNRHSYRN